MRTRSLPSADLACPGAGRHQPSDALAAARLFREVRVSGWSGAQDALAVGQGPLVQRDRLGGPARGPVGQGEVVPGVQGVGVVRAQDPLAVGQGPLVQRNRLGDPARVLVSAGEVVPGGQGGGVVRAEDLLAIGEQRLADLDGPGGAVAEGGRAGTRAPTRAASR